MFIVTKKQIRPNTSVEFFSMNTYVNDRNELKQHFGQTYIFSGKLVSSEDTISTDNLEKTTETRWLSEDDLNQFKNDPICAEMITQMTDYCNQNNISSTTSTQTI